MSEDNHPLIEGLFKTLPEDGQEQWPLDARRKWLQAASHIFELLYTVPDQDEERSIIVEIEREADE